MDFKEFVKDWWSGYLDDCPDSTAERIMEKFIGEEETIEDYIPSDAESAKEWLRDQYDIETIYTRFFGYGADISEDGVPFTEDFLYRMFTQASKEVFSHEPSYLQKYISDMSMHASGYETPDGFFEDLQHGCQSGLIGMLIYNSDCKKIYIEHLDDMEDRVEQLETQFGLCLKSGLPRYTFVTWLCYESLGDEIARVLFPDKF